MKKFFCLILAAAMLLLCACGNTETELQLQDENQIENTADSAPQEEEAAEETAAPLFEEETEEAAAEEEKNIKSYVLNERSYKIHEPSCYSVEIMAEHNKNYVEADLQDLLNQGYSRCGNCYPN